MADANGKGVSVTRVVLDELSRVFEDAGGTRSTPGFAVTRRTLTTWYVQYHVPAGEPGAGQGMACGEVTLGGFDRGAPFQ